MSFNVEGFMEKVIAKNPGEAEFHQAVREVVETLADFLDANPKYQEYKILERMVEPERAISFRVPWVDDKGEIQVNRGYRVQFNSAIGPYKGGLRFHPSVNLSMMKFLGFEQTFKNSLTTLPMGGGKGGADFDPTGKSDAEVMRFCHAFMNELFRHIGPDTDIPAGDVGVGAREIGYLFGQYKKLQNHFVGVLTGKGLQFGGSLVRPEATGFGTVYFDQHMLAELGDSIVGKKVALSGFGNVAWGAAKKLLELGAKVVAISGPDGYVYIEDGMTAEGVDYMLELRASNRNIVAPFADQFPGAKFFPKQKAWAAKCDIAFPCAFQNELNLDDAKTLVANGCKMVVETSNMGCTADAVSYLVNTISFAPGKAANAGGVACSGLEMSQNAGKISWTAEEVGERLSQIMKNIHDTCVKYGKEGDKINYVKGANIGGFIKVADAMIAQGVC